MALCGVGEENNVAANKFAQPERRLGAELETNIAERRPVSFSRSVAYGEETAMDWRTWAPFQSEKTRRICANMTPEEKEAALMRGTHYGVWVAITFAVPLGFAVAFHNTAVMFIAAILIAIHIACIPIWQRWQRQFLCSTEWARQQEISPEQLKLFAWRHKENIST